jgi:hypothetical protein
MAEEGLLTSDVVLPAILEGADSVNASFARMNTTVSSAATVFMNSTMAMVGTADSASESTNSLAEAILGMSDVLDAMTKAMKDSNGEGQVFSAVLEGLSIALETIVVIAANVALAFKLVGNAIGAAAAAAVQLATNGIESYNAVLEASNAKALELTESTNKFTKSIVTAREKGEFYRQTMKEMVKTGGEVNSANYQAIKSNGLSVAAQKEAEKAAKAAAAASKKAANESAAAAKKAAAETQRALEEESKAREKAYQEYVSDLNKLHAEYDKSVEASNKLVAAAQAEYDQYGLTRTEIAALTIATEEQKLSEMELAQAMNGTYEATKLAIAAQKERIKAMKEANSINVKSDTRKAEDEANKKSSEESLASAKKTADDVAAEWQKTADTIQSSITDALMRGFESGKGFGQNLVDTMKNLFKSLVLQPVVKMGVQGGLGAIGLGGLSGAASAADGVSSLGSLSGLGGMVSSGLGWLSGGGAGVGGIAAGASVAGQGATNAVSGLATSMGGLASGITAALPYIGLAVGAFALLKDAFKGETRSGAGFSVNGITGEIFGSGGPSGGDFTKGEAGKQLAAMVQTANGILKSVGSALSVTGAVGGLETSGKGRGGVYVGGTLSTGAAFGQTFQQSNRGSYTTEEAANLYVKKLNDSVIEALKSATDTPEAIKKLLSSGAGSEQIIAAVQAQSEAVSVFSQVIKLMPMQQLANLSYDAKAGIIELSGGLESLAGNLKTYHDNYYTEAEKVAAATKNVSDALSSVGVSMPATREAFRALVESQDLTTEAGQKAYATLLQVSGSFAELNPIAEQTTENTKAETTAKEELNATQIQAAELTKTNADLQAELNALLGITAPMLDSANAALNEQNNSIRKQITEIQAKKEAEKAAAESKRSLEERLFQLQATAAQKREAEIAAYGASNRALAEYVIGLEDAANAIQKLQETKYTQSSLVDRYDAAGAAQRAADEIFKAFDNAGHADKIPRTASELANLIASLDPLIDADIIAGLNGLSSAFDTVFRAAEEAARASEAAANAPPETETRRPEESRPSVKDKVDDTEAQKKDQTAREESARSAQRAGLESQLLQLQGNTMALRMLELAQIDPSNRALQAHIYILQDEANVRAAAAAKLAEITAERVGLENQMLQLQGNTVELRKRELENIDPTNRAIQELIWKLQDQAVATDQAAAAADQLAQKQAAIASERYGLETQLLQAQGNTAELRKRELEKLDPSNKALLEQIYALEDQKAAAEEAARAQQAAAQAAQQATDNAARAAEDAQRAMDSVYESISSALKSLMGQSDTFAQTQRAQAKITLQSALAVAKAGGSLVGFAGLDQALGAIGNIDKSGFGSYVDYAREYGQSVGLLSELEKYTNPRGSHANGLDNVPYDGYMAQLHKGERVQTAREAQSGGESALQLKEMREELKAMIIPLVEESVRSRKILSKWDGDGMPEVRTV